MQYAMPASNSPQRITGLAFVGLMHLAILALVATAVVKMPQDRPQKTDVVLLPQNKPKETPVQQTPLKQPNMESDIVRLPYPEVPLQVNPPEPPISGLLSTDIPNSVPSVPTNAGQKSEGIKSASLGIACPNSQSVRESVTYPMAARREGIQGDVVARFVVSTTGQIKDIAIVQSSSRLFNLTVMSAIREFQCVGQAQDIQVEVPFTFRLNN